MSDIVILKKVGYTREEFIELCIELKTTAALAEFADCTRMTVHRCLNKYFPDLPNRDDRLDNRFLALTNRRRCGMCNEPKPVEDFNLAPNYCKPCFNVYTKPYSAERRARKVSATPDWADKEKIKEIYRNCPEGYQVDHIIPLKGEKVCGLHVENNLQYLTESDNIKKSNKFEVG
jgi:hypothetical protein